MAIPREPGYQCLGTRIGSNCTDTFNKQFGTDCVLKCVFNFGNFSFCLVFSVGDSIFILALRYLYTSFALSTINV